MAGADDAPPPQHVSSHARLPLPIESLTVTRVPLYIDHATATEFIPVPRVQHMATTSSEYDMTSESQKNAAKFYNHEGLQFQALLKQVATRKTPGFSCTYGRAEDQIGRCYPQRGLGLASYRRKVREALAYDAYIDFDIANAQPTMMQQLCARHNVPCPFLEFYITHREEILKKIQEQYEVPRAKAKKLVLRLMFYGTVAGWRTENSIPDSIGDIPFLAHFRKELDAIGVYLMKANPHLVATSKNKTNKMGSVCALILQDMETRTVSALIEHLATETSLTTVDKVKNVWVYAWDGIMLHKDAVAAFGGQDAVLALLTQKTIELSGFSLAWEVKEMQRDANFDLDALFAKNTDISGEEGRIARAVVTDREAAEKLFRLYPHWKFFNRTLFVFNDSTGMWSEEEVDRNAVVNRFSDELHLKSHDGKTWKVSQSSYGNSSTLRSRIWDDMAVLANDEYWIERVRFTSIGKLLFKNGWYDSKTNEFHKEFTPAIFFPHRVPLDYQPCDTAERIAYRDSVRQRMFLTPLGGEVGTFLCQHIARSVMGDRTKHFTFCVGRGDTGKSVLASALDAALGKLASPFAAENIACASRSSDESTTMRFTIAAEYSRLLIASECRMNSKFDSNLVKKLSSGGLDCIMARTHYKAEQRVFPHFGSFIFSKDVQQLDACDDAVMNRLITIKYTRKYVNDPQCEDELLRDDNIKHEIMEEDFRMGLLHAFMDAYQVAKREGVLPVPDSVLANNVEWFKEAGDPVRQLEAAFVFTDDEHDFTPSKDIENFRNARMKAVSAQKLAELVRKHAEANGLSNVKAETRRLKGAQVRGWTGVKPFRLLDTSSLDTHTAVCVVETDAAATTNEPAVKRQRVDTM